MAERSRKYPGIDRGNLRPDRKQKRREEAALRQLEWDKMSDKQRAEKHAAKGYTYVPKYSTSTKENNK